MNVKTIAFAAVACLAAGVGLATAQTFPTRPITVIVPYAPGGGTDTMARFIANGLETNLGQPVVVENRPGGNTIIGTQTLVESKPDGYTIELIATATLIVPLLYDAPFHPVDSFSPIATISRSEELLLANPAFPANTVGELVAMDPAALSNLNYATVGTGGPANLAMESLNLKLGSKIQSVAFSGTVPAVTALVSGEVDLYLAVPGATLPHVESGRIKALAVTGAKRLPSLPDVPTFAEAGMPDFEAAIWYGFLAPKDTPADVIDLLSAEIMKIAATPEFGKILADLGQDPFISNKQDFKALLETDAARYRQIIKDSGFEVEK